MDTPRGSEELVTWDRERELSAARWKREGVTLVEIGRRLQRDPSSIFQKFDKIGFHHLTPEELRVFEVMPSKSSGVGSERMNSYPDE